MSLRASIAEIRRSPVGLAEIQVPVDVARADAQQEVQWLPSTLSSSRVGNQLEPLEVLEGVRQLQQHCGQVTRLLVDKKMHYSILKMLYSKGWQRWDLRGVAGPGAPVVWAVARLEAGGAPGVPHLLPHHQPPGDGL